MTINISENDKTILNKILNKYKNDFDFFAFGSRVTGTNSDYSDLDICFVLKTNAPIHNLKDELEESNLTIKIDLIDYKLIDEDFRAIIDSHKIKL